MKCAPIRMTRFERFIKNDVSHMYGFYSTICQLVTIYYYLNSFKYKLRLPIGWTVQVSRV